MESIKLPIAVQMDSAKVDSNKTICSELSEWGSLSIIVFILEIMLIQYAITVVSERANFWIACSLFVLSLALATYHEILCESGRKKSW